MRAKQNLYILISALALSGCVSGTLDFKVRYQDASGLRKDDRVLFEESHVGVVKDVKYTDQGDFLVDISIRREFANEATEYSRFYISLDPKLGDRQAVHMVRVKDGGAPIQEDSIVAGTTKHAFLYDQFSAKLRDNLERFELELNSFVESLTRLPESEQIKRLEQELDRLLAELQHLGAEMKHKLKSEILPRIKEEIEELRRRLEALGREDDLKPVDRKMEELITEL
jgi:archaellum component FlaC